MDVLTVIQAYIDEVVESLFSLCVTLGNVPIIRCRSNDCGELIASKLTSKYGGSSHDNLPLCGARLMVSFAD